MIWGRRVTEQSQCTLSKKLYIFSVSIFYDLSYHTNINDRFIISDPLNFFHKKQQIVKIRVMVFSPG